MSITTNEPTATWRNPYWGTLSGDMAKLRPIFESLSNFLARPTFNNGVDLGDGATAPSVDPTTGVPTVPPTTRWDSTAVDLISGSLASLGTDLATVNTTLTSMQSDITSLETDPIDGTRITDNTIATPKLQANSITAAKLAAVNIGVGKWIASTSYVAGTSGWIIDAAGTAEFNSVTVRGSLYAGSGNITVDSNGIRLAVGTGAVNTIAWMSGGSGVASLSTNGSGSLSITASGGINTAAAVTMTGAVSVSGTSPLTIGSSSSIVSVGSNLNIQSWAMGATYLSNSSGSLTARDASFSGNVSLDGYTLTCSGMTFHVFGTFYTVSLGAVDSAGAGFRVMRVPN